MIDLLNILLDEVRSALDCTHIGPGEGEYVRCFNGDNPPKGKKELIVVHDERCFRITIEECER